jgi:hypothetical protein
MRKLLPFFLLCLPVFASAQSTGFMAPTATAAPNGGWTNPTDAFASDDVYTTVPHQSGCRCPFLYLSWDNGTSYTSPQLVGPFGTSDNTMTAGSPTDLWGHAWTETELSNASFRLKIANPSTLIEQGYADFNFVIPSGSAILGIEVRVEQHGDSAFTMEYIDVIEVNVHYTSSTGTGVASAVSAVNVYPNPANAQLNIDHLSSTTQRIAITDMTGRTVMETMHFDSDRYTFDVSELPAGLYLVIITDSAAPALTRRIVVE